MARIRIELTGRIPKYFFGALKEEYREEIKTALQHCNKEEVESESGFLEKIFALTLDGWNNPKEELYKAIAKEQLEKLPKFSELVNDFIENGGSHFEMIDCLFDSIDMAKYGSIYGISFFEDDAYITVSDYESNKVILEQTKLADFILGGPDDGIWAEDVQEGTEAHQELSRLKEFRTKNDEFGFDPEDGYFSWYKNKLGCTFLATGLKYSELVEFTNIHPKEEQVTIYFDDTTTWSFIVDTENEEFDFKNLIFVSYLGADEFRNAARPIVFSHLFYRNDLINPEENWLRDKGISLMYGEKRGMERLDFFIYG